MAVDLLFGGVCVVRRKGSFRLLPNLLDGLNGQEILSRHCFGSEPIDHEYITNLLKPKLERQTKNNSVNRRSGFVASYVNCECFSNNEIG